MLNELRSLAGNLGAKLLLAFLVITFGIWGIGDMLRHNGRNVNIATVGDKNISLEEYQRSLRRETENVRQAIGENYSPEMLKTLDLPHHVLHDLVTQTLLKLESASLQIVPSDTDVVRRIRSNQRFQDSKGNFDKNIFEAFLRNNGISEKIYVDHLRQDIASGIIADTLMASVPLPETAVQTLYEARNQERTATLYILGTSSIPTAKPDDAQVEAYYHAHENEFKAPEYRSISYVSFTNADVQAKATVSEDELKGAYQERIDEFKKPERRVVDQLIYDSEDKAKKAAAMLKAGTSFDQVAKTTPIINKNATSMGKTQRDQLVESAEDAVFSLPKDGFTDPIQSPFGWHIFRVTAIEPPATASFEESRAAIEKDLKQKSGEEALNKMANSLEDSLAGGSTLPEAAKEFGLTIHTVGPLDRAGRSPDDSPAKGLPEFDKFIDTAFKTEEKTESSLVSSKGGLNYLLRVDSITPAHLRNLAEVKSQATANLQRQELNKHMAALAEDLAKKFSVASTREALITSDKLKISPVGPFKQSDQKSGELKLPQSLKADIFSHKPGESTSAYPLDNGDYAIAVVKDIIPADKSSKNDKALADIREEIGNAARHEILEEYTRYLGGKYAITVNQSLLEAPSDNAAE